MDTNTRRSTMGDNGIAPNPAPNADPALTALNAVTDMIAVYMDARVGKLAIRRLATIRDALADRITPAEARIIASWMDPSAGTGCGPEQPTATATASSGATGRSSVRTVSRTNSRSATFPKACTLTTSVESATASTLPTWKLSHPARTSFEASVSARLTP
ncbi:hypothetical protein [Clavibacter capsici]|uniref:hypothetical protein n=1 Tax=Clavibacter capsici TaxID=1874630 RepID=UPI00287BBC8E|nr:hypothetical protein [Clavibacter capsici]